MSEGQFTFHVVARSRRPSSAHNCGFLIEDDWDDWFTYSTMYTFVVFTEAGSRVDLGSVKIGQFGMIPKQRRPEIPAEFERLSDQFFSLGQSDEYYEQLANMDESTRRAILDGLRDVVADQRLWEREV